METITLALPTDTYQLLMDRARKTGKSAREVLLELLDEALKTNAESPPDSRRRQTASQILSASGRLRTLSPHLQNKIIPNVTLRDVQESLRKVGGKSLSEIILEQRGLRTSDE